jgi:hypothetical protein
VCLYLQRLPSLMTLGVLFDHRIYNTLSILGPFVSYKKMKCGKYGL